MSDGIIKLEQATRWDTLAYRYYGDCYNIKPLIEANTAIPIGAFIPAGTEVIIPEIVRGNNYNSELTEVLPVWKADAE